MTALKEKHDNGHLFLVFGPTTSSQTKQLFIITIILIDDRNHKALTSDKLLLVKIINNEKGKYHTRKQ